MSYIGGYLGLTPSAPTTTVTPPPAPVPVALPAQADSLQLVDHVSQALARLSEQFKSKAT